MIWGRAVSLVNAAGATGAAGAAGGAGGGGGAGAVVGARAVAVEGAPAIASLRFTSRVLAIDAPPRRGDTVVDLQGAWVLPGLINAHDHLELNHYGRLKFRERYANATDWIEDMSPRLTEDPSIRCARRHPLTDRLFIGALKNLLAGVTTVAHHNPHYSELRRTMPIRVVRRYGWAHSFALERRPVGARGEPGGEIAQRWRRTSADVPFLVHLAEGVDEAAASELQRLEALGCLAPNTIVVHGVAISADGFSRMAAAGTGLVWCPASNVFLLGRTAAVRLFVDAAHGQQGAADATHPRGAPVALGSDSRLTGSNDLLEELGAAWETRCASAEELLAMVTVNPARMLRLRRAGELSIGGPADFMVVPNRGAGLAESLLATRRRDVGLVVVGGRPLIGNVPMAAIFHARNVVPRTITVDGLEKLADSGLVRRIEGSPIMEPGVMVP